MRYTANSLKTHNNSKEFEEEVLKDILSISPLHVQSLAIPINEFNRLNKKFKTNKENNGIEPTVIYIEEKAILNNMKIDGDKYCLVSNNKSSKIYISKVLEDLCD